MPPYSEKPLLHGSSLDTVLEAEYRLAALHDITGQAVKPVSPAAKIVPVRKLG